MIALFFALQSPIILIKNKIRQELFLCLPSWEAECFNFSRKLLFRAHLAKRNIQCRQRKSGLIWVEIGWRMCERRANADFSLIASPAMIFFQYFYAHEAQFSVSKNENSARCGASGARGRGKKSMNQRSESINSILYVSNQTATGWNIDFYVKILSSSDWNWQSQFICFSWKFGNVNYRIYGWVFARLSAALQNSMGTWALNRDLIGRFTWVWTLNPCLNRTQLPWRMSFLNFTEFISLWTWIYVVKLRSHNRI